MDFQKIITIDPKRRGGKPTIRGMRITVDDILKMLANEMTTDQILNDFPELQKKDIFAALQFASQREHFSSIQKSETAV